MEQDGPHRQPIRQHEIIGVDERDEVGRGTERRAAVAVPRGVGLHRARRRVQRLQRLQAQWACSGCRERVLTCVATQLSDSGVVVRARSEATTSAHSSASVSERATTTCAAGSVCASTLARTSGRCSRCLGTHGTTTHTVRPLLALLTWWWRGSARKLVAAGGGGGAADGSSIACARSCQDARAKTAPQTWRYRVVSCRSQGTSCLLTEPNTARNLCRRHQASTTGCCCSQPRAACASPRLVEAGNAAPRPGARRRRHGKEW